MVCDVLIKFYFPEELVLILILLEYGLRPDLMMELWLRNRNVLILILLEYGLRQNKSIILDIQTALS